MKGEEVLSCYAYRCDRDVSQQMKLGAGGIVDKQLGLQQAQLQKPNGGDDGTEVEENHGREPKRRPPKEREGGGRLFLERRCALPLVKE